MKVNNLKVLKTILSQSQEDSLDDSLNDSLYRPELKEASMESGSSESKNSADVYGFESDEENIDELKIFNPFLKTSEKNTRC